MRKLLFLACFSLSSVFAFTQSPSKYPVSKCTAVNCVNFIDLNHDFTPGHSDTEIKNNSNTKNANGKPNTPVGNETIISQTQAILPCMVNPSGTKTVVNAGAIQEGDSLALVALYNQCNGLNWTKQTNWLSGPVSTWEGVAVENNRVVSLELCDWNSSVNLTGQLPAELSNLSELRTLNLMNNILSGNLPESLSSLVNLQWLTLANNQFTGTLPVSWSSLVNLQYLYLNANQLSGSLPVSWSALVHLKCLKLNQNFLSGPLPENWSALISLTWLDLSSNQITGILPVSWSALVNLNYLLLSYNQLTGPLPASWSSLVHLIYLEFAYNPIAGTLPESWSSLVNLTQLTFCNSELTGSLPESWSSLVKMKTLWLSRSHITGSLPATWSSLVNLEALILNENQLSGTLPDSWSALVKIEQLWLSFNQLTGNLPVSWSALVNARDLTLNWNQLTDSVPGSWSALGSILNLWLNHNQLSGLPDLSPLTTLSQFTVMDNLLDFGDIEPNIGIANNQFYYVPQDLIGKPDTILKKTGEEVSIAVEVGGSSNQYQWYKDGMSIQDATTAEYMIQSITLGDSGEYTCQITNTIVNDLMLTSHPITLQVESLTPVKENEIPGNSGQLSFSIYPNPTRATFILEFKNEIPDSNLKVAVYGIQGVQVLTGILSGERKHEFSLSNRPAGIYFIRVISDTNTEIAMIIKQ